jgi:hypothetical protein
MAKYLQRSCPKCNGYLGIVVPERKAKVPVQAINGRCFEMWLSPGVGFGSEQNVNGTKPKTPKLVSSSRRQLNQICYCL